MKGFIKKLAAALCALALAATYGAAYAGTTGKGDTGSATPQQSAPKDCKKDPNDPRCKEKKDQGSN